jgi:hypothetical protein
MDRTRPVTSDLTRPSVRLALHPSPHAHNANASIRQHAPDAGPARLIAPLASSGKSDRMRRCTRSSVRSLLSPLGQQRANAYN